MAWFQAFRSNYGFMLYPDNRSSVTQDKSVVMVTYLCTLLGIATLIATLGIKGRERWSFVLRASYAVTIGSIIIACLVGHGWQTGSVRIRTGYVYRNNRLFEGYIGVSVALDGANVTLDGYYEGISGRGFVYYSESILWQDFGRESPAYTSFLERGLPDPILKVMAFITANEGKISWGHSFNTSGYFTMILLCTSLAFWIITNLLLCSVVVYSAYLFLITGFVMVLSCITYHVCQLRVSLLVRFNDGSLQLFYGWSFWLAMVAGCVTFILGLVMVVADHFDHDSVADFFHLEKLVREDYIEPDKTQNTGDLALAASGASGSPEKPASIFQNLYKKPKKTRENSRRNGLLPGQSAFLIRSTGHSKFNQIHSDPDQIKQSGPSGNEQNNMCQLECLCEETEMSMGDAGISSSEIKEDGDKVVTESHDIFSFVTADNQNKKSDEKQHKEVRFKNNIFTIDLTEEGPLKDTDSICGRAMPSKPSRAPINDDSPVNSLNGYMVSDNSDDSNHCGIYLPIPPDQGSRPSRESTTRNDESLDSGIEVAHGFDNKGYPNRRNSVHVNTFNLDTIVNMDDS